MSKSFVALNDPVHNLLRHLARRTPLVERLSPEGGLRMYYQPGAEGLSEQYAALAWFGGLNGLPAPLAIERRSRLETRHWVILAERVGGFDVAKLDRRCARDVRLHVCREGLGMLAGELLSYGTGLLRARNDDPGNPLHRLLWRRYGRLAPKEEIIYATIRCLSGHGSGGEREAFDSTNVIPGDALGELQQLWDRRADSLFLDRVARSLEAIGRNAFVAAFLQPPRNLKAAVQLHMRAQRRWRRPPENGRALLRRVEWILDHTALDYAPPTLFRWQQHRSQTGTGERGTPSAGWPGDLPQGDDWLTGDNPV